MAGSAGNGPVCPVDATHGRTYDYRQKTARPGRDFWCPHSAHGGNGKFFTDKEAHGGYELQEGDVTLIYETAARDVIAGRATLDRATQDVARHTGRPTSQVREAVTIMIDSIKEKDQTMAESKAAAAARKQRKASPPPGERHRLERAEGSLFKDVLTRHGLTSKQATEATGEAGLGKSSTYIYILLHDGASVDLFDKFKAAVEDWAARNKDVLKEAKKTATKTARKTTTKVAKAPADDDATDRADPADHVDDGPEVEPSPPRDLEIEAVAVEA